MLKLEHKDFSYLEFFTSSNVKEDPDNVFYIRSNVNPFELSFESTINLIFEHVEKNENDTSGWP